MDELVDRFGVASNLVDSFFMDLINGTNQESVDEAFKNLGLSRSSVENKLIQVNEKVNPFDPDKMVKLYESGVPDSVLLDHTEVCKLIEKGEL